MWSRGDYYPEWREEPVNRSDALDAAKAAVEQRNKRYGEPEDNFTRIAMLWNAYLACRRFPTVPLTATDIAIMSGLFKVARLANDPTHQDSWVDLAGYAACGAECAHCMDTDPDFNLKHVITI